MVGRTILHYKILKEIGKGGMGIVYKATDTKLHRAVAIKALATELVGDEKARTRFLREARAASSIDHPNICTVYEINEVDNLLFFVMPYIEGQNLKKYINGRPLPVEQALEFALQITDALAEAHHKNVLHRDIKSANVMINERGQIKILDFGLAKLTKTSSDESLIVNELTQLGKPFGTASYMSPEQARGEAADARSDIFSLGIVIYEMLAGRLPFRGKTSVDVMHAVLHTEPDALENVPLRFQNIILKALAKDKTARYQTADAMLDELRAFARSFHSQQSGGGAPFSSAYRASTRPQKETGLAGRLAGWMQKAFGKSQPAVDDLQDTGTPTTDSSPSKIESTPPSDATTTWKSRDKKALAILPFKNLSGNSADEFYSFSLADCVITELAQLRDLIVRPSSYIAQFQGKEIDPRAIGNQLTVDAVLVSGYIKAGDRFRVTPQLIDVASGDILWSEKIDVDAKDIITLQDTISQLIVEGLRVRTTSKEQAKLAKKSPTENPQAYENYLKARTVLYKFLTQTLNVQDLEEAIELFESALDMDGDFALAHSGLGLCYLNYVLKGIGGVEYYTRAKAAFEVALALDPNLIESCVRMVYIDLLEGRSQQARAEIRRLLKKAPNEPSVHSAAAYVYRLSGQYEKALEQWAAYLKISPTDIVFASYNRARIYVYQRDWAKAKSEIAMGLAIEPNHPNLKIQSGVIAYFEGQIDKATQIMEAVLAKNPELHSHKLHLAAAYLARGERDRAFELIDEKVEATAYADQDNAYRLASVYALDKQEDKAIEWLLRAIEMGNENFRWFAVDPRWEALRASPGYQEFWENLKARRESLQEPEK
ncbi:MAG: protein kinase [Acidobacteriota bacterium]